MEKLEYSRFNTNLNKNEFITVPWSGDLFSYTKGAYEFSVKFCVVKFSSFG